MRLRRFGFAAVVVVVIMAAPYHYTVPFRLANGTVPATASCIPLREVSKTRPDGGLFGYAPGARSIDLVSSFCGRTARRRVGIGAVPLVAGTGLLLWNRRRGRSN